MSGKRKRVPATNEAIHQLRPQIKIWLKATYHFHVFHYRMPGTAAIAAITPFVPSPLTVKMALIAALLQKGEDSKARALACYLPQMEIRIRPPSAAFSFKSFLRYRSVPAVETTGGLDETGSLYPSRPHTREYALFADELTIYVGLPEESTSLTKVVREALENMRYLGCRDSQVWCRGVEEVQEPQELCVSPMADGKPGVVALLADFSPDAKPSLEDLIPGSRKRDHYLDPLPPFVIPGNIMVKGRTRLFLRGNGNENEG